MKSLIDLKLVMLALMAFMMLTVTPVQAEEEEPPAGEELPQ